MQCKIWLWAMRQGLNQTSNNAKAFVSMQLVLYLQSFTADHCYHSFSQYENITFKTKGTKADFGHDGFPCCCFSPLMCSVARGSRVIRLRSGAERGRAARWVELASTQRRRIRPISRSARTQRPLKGSDRKPAPGWGQEYRCHQLEWREPES